MPLATVNMAFGQALKGGTAKSILAIWNALTTHVVHVYPAATIASSPSRKDG
jgi:hypothetical protein